MPFYQDFIKIQEIKLLFKSVAESLFIKLSATLKLQEVQLSLDAQKKRKTCNRKWVLPRLGPFIWFSVEKTILLDLDNSEKFTI
tara:strand:- start:2699 stop:2950 length:252 start_codon:yes stop_codon:yes gene_type:complete